MSSFLFFLILFLPFSGYSKCRAVIVNGGSDVTYNYRIHETQIREMYNSLRSNGCKDEDIFVFSGSGKVGAKEFRVDPVSSDSPYVSSDYKFNDGKTVQNLLAADKKNIQNKLASISKDSKPEDKVFIYLSDHGTARARADGTTLKGLVPWDPDHTELFTVQDLEKALENAPASTQINIWADCCFCGVFNKVKRSNTCVATSTDEYHLGSYFWTEDLSKNPKASIRARFAGELSQNSKASLGQAAISATMAPNDEVYLSGSYLTGCLIGPRNSAEQYVFEVVGFGDKQLCIKDLEEIYSGKPKSRHEFMCEDPARVFPEVERFKNITQVLEKASNQASKKSQNRIKKLLSEMRAIIKEVEQDPELEKIRLLQTGATPVTAEGGGPLNPEQMMAFQLSLRKARLQVMGEHKFFEKFSKSQKLIVEELFKAKASQAQKVEYERRKACLKEPLF